MTLISVLFVLVFVLITAQVARVAYTRKLPDMYWLAGNFGAAAIGNFFTMIVVVPILGILGMIASALCTVMFVQRGFYRDRKSPYLYFIGLVLALGVYQIYSAITNPTAFLAMTQLGWVVVWGWQAFVAFNTRRAIGDNRTVEDWVKARLWLWFGYTFFMFLNSGRMLLPIPYASFEFMITTPLTILAVFVQYITWAMPEPIRHFLNRKYQPVAVASPAELMAMAEAELQQ